MPSRSTKVTNRAEERPEIAELLRRATELVPVIRARGRRCEELRQLPDETVADIKQAGFHRIMHPPIYGGMGYGMEVAAEVTMEIGRGCGATAWMVCQWAAHNFIVSMFSREAQDDYWKGTPDALCATASAQESADLQDVNGGTKISGRWRFSSGIDHADWVILMLPQGNFLIPKSDYSIADDWFVSGLLGSGSKTVVISDAFVPAYRRLPMEDLVMATNYGSAHYEAPYYQLSSSIWGLLNVSPAIIGVALAILELFEERVLKRKDLQTQSPAYDRPGNQLRYAESSVEIDVARMLLRNLHAELTATLKKGERLTLVDRARFRRDATYATKLCLQAAQRLFSAGDASAIYTAMPIQRFVRDLQAAALHVSQTWDEPAIQYSRVRWGLDPQTPLL